jgi:hypothetical protein
LGFIGVYRRLDSPLILSAFICGSIRTWFSSAFIGVHRRLIFLDFVVGLIGVYLRLIWNLLYY